MKIIVPPNSPLILSPDEDLTYPEYMYRKRQWAIANRAFQDKKRRIFANKSKYK